MQTFINLNSLKLNMLGEEFPFLIVAPIVIGLVISIVELIFVHADESGLGWLSHGLHAVPTTLIFTFISMNSQLVLAQDFMSWMPAWLGMYAIPVIIGLVAAIKVKAAAAIARGGSVGEKMWHALVIGALIAAAPFVYPLVESFIPPYLAW